MEDQTQTNKDIEKLTKIVDLLDSFTVKQGKLTKQSVKYQKELSEEVVFLRGCNESIEETIKSSVNDNLPKFTRSIEQPLKGLVNSQVQTLATPINALKNELTSFANTITKTHEKQSEKLKRTGLYTLIAFCFGSLLTGAGLWYFFPQHHTTNVEFSPKQRKAMEMGTLLKFAMPKLSKADQEKVNEALGKSWDEYYKELFADVRRG